MQTQIFQNPLHLGFLSASTSRLTHQSEVGGKKINRKRVLWTCLEVVPQRYSTLHPSAVQVNGKHQTQISSSTRTSRNTWFHQVSVSQWKQQESARISQEGFWCISLQEVSPTKTSKAFHGVPTPEHPLSVYGVIFIFLNITCPLKCLFSANHYMPSHMIASPKTKTTTAKKKTIQWYN